jgi:hypothetical protein
MEICTFAVRDKNLSSYLQDDQGDFSSVSMDTAVAIRTLEATYKSSAESASVELMIAKLTEKVVHPYTIFESSLLNCCMYIVYTTLIFFCCIYMSLQQHGFTSVKPLSFFSACCDAGRSILEK